MVSPGQLVVLIVAEKPAIAGTLAEALCPPGTAAVKRRGVSPSSPVYEYDGEFNGCPAKFKVTATNGHVYSLSFGQEHSAWDDASFDEFTAATRRVYDGQARMPEHLQVEGKGVDCLILWLDCDRDGENICFEVIGEVLPNMRMPPRAEFPGAYQDCIYRARFSSLAHRDLLVAMNSLGVPNENEARSVDARMEVDLRVGVAISRLQTMYFRRHFAQQFGMGKVLYGPCETPTLWFCVKRHCDRKAFVPEPYWVLGATLMLTGDDGSHHADATRGAIRNEAEATDILNALQGAAANAALKGDGSVAGRTRGWLGTVRRPLPLNTVEMLKLASERLGLGPAEALQCAETLYLNGILSYPRTHTNRYPAHFDIEGSVQAMATSFLPWAREAATLLAEGWMDPRIDGHDAGDHPPITPVKAATSTGCGGQVEWALYQEICRHFLATVSRDASFQHGELVVDIGVESFRMQSRRCLNSGWALVSNKRLEDEGPLDFASMERRVTVQVIDVALQRKVTEAPRHITESELLTLMDKHGIGTDSSMAKNVGCVQRQRYVELDGETREMRPSSLGLALCHAYSMIDEELVLPTVRSSIENACADVARGWQLCEIVVDRSLRIFKRKFYLVARRLDRLPLLLSVALAQDAGAKPIAGDAAMEGLELFRRASARTAQMALEDLLLPPRDYQSDFIDYTCDDVACDITEALDEPYAVARVQQAMLELGIGERAAGAAGGAMSFAAVFATAEGDGTEGKGALKERVVAPALPPPALPAPAGLIPAGMLVPALPLPGSLAGSIAGDGFGKAGRGGKREPGKGRLGKGKKMGKPKGPQKVTPEEQLQLQQRQMERQQEHTEAALWLQNIVQQNQHAPPPEKKKYPKVPPPIPPPPQPQVSQRAKQRERQKKKQLEQQAEEEAQQQELLEQQRRLQLQFQHQQQQPSQYQPPHSLPPLPPPPPPPPPGIASSFESLFANSPEEQQFSFSNNYPPYWDGFSPDLWTQFYLGEGRDVGFGGGSSYDMGVGEPYGMGSGCGLTDQRIAKGGPDHAAFTMRPAATAAAVAAATPQGSGLGEAERAGVAAGASVLPR